MNVFTELILPIIICIVFLGLAIVLTIYSISNDGSKIVTGAAIAFGGISIIVIIGFSINFASWQKVINEREYLDEYSYKGFLDKLDGTQGDYIRQTSGSGYTLYVTLPYQDSLSENDQLKFRFVNSSNVLEGTLKNGLVGDKTVITSVTNYSSDNGQSEEDLKYEARQVLKDMASYFIIRSMQTYFYTNAKYKTKHDKTVDIRNFGIFPNYSDEMVTTYKRNYNVW